MQRAESTSTASENERIREALTLADALDQALLFSTPDGAICGISASAQRRFGRDRVSVVGQSLHHLTTGERAALSAYLNACARSGSALPGTLTLANGTGGPAVLRCTGARCQLTWEGGPLVALLVSPKNAAIGRFASLNQQIDALSKEVSRRRAAESELVRQHDVLEHALNKLAEEDRRKSQFFAILGHELRNPLAPLRNAVGLIRRSQGDSELYEKACQLMERQIAHMVRLVDDLLDVSRFETGKVTLIKEHLDIASILRSAVETSTPAMEAAGHELDLALPEAAVFVEGDRVRLAQLFANLLNNAARYTPAGGHIRLSAREREGGVAVCVEDDGIGIPPAMLENVFDMFRQADDPQAQTGGLGIGLGLARAVAQMHGGTISAHSEGLETGSTFTVWLPTAAETADPVPEPAATCAIRSGGRRILVADDNADAAASMAMLLRLAGHEVVTATDGQEAVEQTEAFAPEVIVLDIGMPRLNGYEAARRICQTRLEPRPLLIAVSGWGQDDDKQRALDAGFDFHLTKPVMPEQLESLLQRQR